MSHQSRKLSILLYGVRLVKVLLSILVIVVAASFFGASAERDLWVYSTAAINSIILLAWGPVTETFRTKFIYIKELQGETEALKRASSLLGTVFLITLCLTIVVFLAAHGIAGLVAPGVPPSQLVQLTHMIQALALTLLLTQITNLLSAILNAFEIFFVPEVLGIITTIINIVSIYLLTAHFGIYSLVWGQYIGLSVLLISLLFYLLKKGIKLEPKAFFKINSSITFLKFAFPYYLPYLAGQIAGVVEKSIASLFPLGSVSVLDYARRLVDGPMSPLVAVMSTLLLPLLSKYYIQQNKEGFNLEFKKIFQLGMLFFAAFLPFIMLNAGAIVAIIYGTSDQITAAQLEEIRILTVAYSINWLAIFCYQILLFTLTSSGAIKYLAFWGFFPQLISILGNFLFYKTAGLLVFPISSFIAHGVVALIYMRRYPFKERHLRYSSAKYILLVVAALVISAILHYIINLDSLFLPIKLLINCIVVITTLCLLAFLFKVEESKLLLKFIKELRTKKIN